MNRLMLLLMILISLLGISGCSQRKPCPKIVYPKLTAIAKVPPVLIHWNKDGSLDTRNAQKLGKQNKHLRVNDYYYHDLIMGYKDNFLKNRKGI